MIIKFQSADDRTLLVILSHRLLFLKDGHQNNKMQDCSVHYLCRFETSQYFPRNKIGVRNNSSGLIKL